MLARLARSPAAWTLAVASAALAFACTTGRIGEGSEGAGPGDSANAFADGIGKSGLRRLTRREYDATLADLLGDTSASGYTALPEDVRDPFDNDFTTQQPSGALIDAIEGLATQAAARALSSPALRSKIVPCTPTGPSDAPCLEKFIRSFGRRALRRTLTDDDVTRFAALQSLAIEANDFWVGVDSVLRAMLQDPRFVYRVEIGTPIDGKPGVFRLDSWEVATRLSYFFWGTTPDDALLDSAERDELRTPEQVRAAAQRLLASPRARERVVRFHALWLGYEQLPHAPELTTAMKKESAALVERVVFEKQTSWFELFRTRETFVNDVLAKHYGLPSPAGGAGWVPYPATSTRRGLLSHGSFLSVAGKFGDTSPTQRGILVRTRLLCQDIPPPPPSVNADEPPAGDGANKCKWDRYAMHRKGGCASCHDKTDPVGFGLENYDQTGKFREHDIDAPECKIEGTGKLVEVGTFKGPAELGDRLIESGLLEKCLVTQVYRFAMGHREGLEDQPYIDALGARFQSSGYKFDQLMLDLASAESFLYRREE